MLGVFFVFCFTLTSAGTFADSIDECNEDVQKLAVANNELGFNLLRTLASESSGNIFISPFSISSAFGMLFYGARGTTAQELRNVLGYEKADLEIDLVSESFYSFLSEVLRNDNSSDGYVLKNANAVLDDKRFGLLEQYRCNVQELFKAVVKDVDFARDAPQIVKEINAWVKEKTNGKIDKLVDQLSSATVLVLLNAVYFKGTWKTQFEQKKTYDEIFYNNGNEERSVQMMHKTSKLPYASINDFQALELPYKGDDVSMIILLPNEMDGIECLEQSLTPEKLADIQGSMYETKVKVSLPKFKLQFEKELSPAMKALGANQIFEPGSADFSGMTPSRNVFVSQIFHKAVIEVNEEGSEAAAATGIAVVLTATLQNRITEFRVDRPFILVIIEKESNMVLFLGKVNNL